MTHIDPALVAEVKARADLRAIVERTVRLKRGTGGTLVGLCPFHHEKTPSFTVYPGARAHFHCYGCGANGNAVGFVMRRDGASFPEAVRTIARDLGLGTAVADTPEARSRRERAEERRRRDDARRREREQREAERTVAWCRKVWLEAAAAPLTPVEQYLRGRGIALPVPPSLKFHPGLMHGQLRRKVPCMVAIVQHVEGHPIGLHRTYLGLYAGGWEKLREGTAKMMAGQCRHGRVRLCAAAPKMGDAEGIESALSVMQETGLPCWAAMTLGNLDAPFPDLVRHVVQLCDADEKKPEEAEAMRRRACKAHRARGLTVEQARPPAGMDFNDVLRAAERDSSTRGVLPLGCHDSSVTA